MLQLYYEEGVKRDKPFIVRDITTKTEQVGYVDTEAQVKRMLYAGENLMQYRRKAYDFQDGEVDLDKAKPDPTLDVGFDPADADLYRRSAQARIEEARKRAERQKKEEVVEEKTDN